MSLVLALLIASPEVLGLYCPEEFEAHLQTHLQREWPEDEAVFIDCRAKTIRIGARAPVAFSLPTRWSEEDARFIALLISDYVGDLPASAPLVSPPSSAPAVRGEAGDDWLEEQTLQFEAHKARMRTAGILVSGLGLGMITIGVLMTRTAYDRDSDYVTQTQVNTFYAGNVLTIVGLAAIPVGVVTFGLGFRRMDPRSELKMRIAGISLLGVGGGLITAGIVTILAGLSDVRNGLSLPGLLLLSGGIETALVGGLLAGSARLWLPLVAITPNGGSIGLAGSF